ncbi:flavin reductase family protein [Shimia aestuarii]|uniref:NADH-FMN oxidoreductase RutF, flavin reductase (DIM6/NTAB) family n=1 Tax=Shimia aestuarii TaxID=254406 RepID=A0A1I4LQ10_9RHOB|nr:flavin reductase family protein [Shimia aestuarii]SFL92903.1 NADH-FMN oxidoreductase RutF, flavin reductase (DIM6/NTAB) family [Shimia aestuarii]
MFYQPKDGHGLPHNPFNALITPRPIAWVSTRDADGRRNLAPYSFFNGTAYVPPQVMFASTGTKPDQAEGKDSLSNIRATGVFCINVVEEAMRDAMNVSTTTFDKDVDEFDRAGLEAAQCETIDCPRLLGAPASLECRMTQIVPLLGENNFMVMGEVVGIHLRDNCIVDGIFDVTTFRPLARLGYRDYSVVDNTFTLARPDD